MGSQGSGRQRLGEWGPTFPDSGPESHWAVLMVASQEVGGCFSSYFLYPPISHSHYYCVYSQSLLSFTHILTIPFWFFSNPDLRICVCVCVQSFYFFLKYKFFLLFQRWFVCGRFPVFSIFCKCQDNGHRILGCPLFPPRTLEWVFHCLLDFVEAILEVAIYLTVVP